MTDLPFVDCLLGLWRKSTKGRSVIWTRTRVFVSSTTNNGGKTNTSDSESVCLSCSSTTTIPLSVFSVPYVALLCKIDKIRASNLICTARPLRKLHVASKSVEQGESAKRRVYLTKPKSDHNGALRMQCAAGALRNSTRQATPAHCARVNKRSARLTVQGESCYCPTPS